MPTYTRAKATSAAMIIKRDPGTGWLNKTPVLIENPPAAWSLGNGGSVGGR